MPKEITSRVCPTEMAGAKVIAYAVVKTENLHTSNTGHNVAGKTKGAATAMIIAQYDKEKTRGFKSQVHHRLGC